MQIRNSDLKGTANEKIMFSDAVKNHLTFIQNTQKTRLNLTLTEALTKTQFLG